MPKPKSGKAEVMWMAYEKGIGFLPSVWGYSKEDWLIRLNQKGWKDISVRCVKVKIEEISSK